MAEKIDLKVGDRVRLIGDGWQDYEMQYHIVPVDVVGTTGIAVHHARDGGSPRAAGTLTDEDSEMIPSYEIARAVGAFAIGDRIALDGRRWQTAYDVPRGTQATITEINEEGVWADDPDCGRVKVLDEHGDEFMGFDVRLVSYGVPSRRQRVTLIIPALPESAEIAKLVVEHLRNVMNAVGIENPDIKSAELS